MVRHKILVRPRVAQRADANVRGCPAFARRDGLVVARLLPLQLALAPHVVESNRVALGLRARVEGRWLAPCLGHSGSQNNCGLRRGSSRTITTIPRTSLEKTMRESMIVGTRTFGPRPSVQERIGTIGIESTRIGATGMNGHLGPRPSAQRRIVATGMASTRIGATDMRGHASPGGNEESVQPSSARSGAAGMRGHATTRALSTGGSIGLGAPPADNSGQAARRTTLDSERLCAAPDPRSPPPKARSTLSTVGPCGHIDAGRTQHRAAALHGASRTQRGEGLQKDSGRRKHGTSYDDWATHATLQELLRQTLPPVVLTTPLRKHWTALPKDALVPHYTALPRAYPRRTKHRQQQHKMAKTSGHDMQLCPIELKPKTSGAHAQKEAMARLCRGGKHRGIDCETTTQLGNKLAPLICEIPDACG